MKTAWAWIPEYSHPDCYRGEAVYIGPARGVLPSHHGLATRGRIDIHGQFVATQGSVRTGEPDPLRRCYLCGLSV